MADHYAVLGVEPDADRAAIERAYRERVKDVHPDHNDAPDADEQFRRVREARDVLVDPDARARYDRERVREAGATGPERTAPGGGERHEPTGAGPASAGAGTVGAGRWVDADPGEWARSGETRRRRRERRARHRRSGRSRSARTAGEAPEWYEPRGGRRASARTDGVLTGGGITAAVLSLLYALAVLAGIYPLPAPARVAVAVGTPLSVAFVRRVPEVAVPAFGVGATVGLPTLLLFGLPFASPVVVVSILALAVPTAVAALAVRL